MPKPYIPNDNWSKRAAAEGYRARSVYKLQQLDERFQLLRTGMTVLDLGAAPGSWLQYTSKKIGSTGIALGLDLKEIAHINGNVKTAQCDITDLAAVQQALTKIERKTVDIVLSDLAPNTTGIKDVDQWRSVELNRSVLTIASAVLRPRGIVVMKVFRGKSFDAFVIDVKRQLQHVKVLTVDATRDRSREVYVLGQQGV